LKKIVAKATFIAIQTQARIPLQPLQHSNELKQQQCKLMDVLHDSTYIIQIYFTWQLLNTTSSIQHQDYKYQDYKQQVQLPAAAQSGDKS